MDVLKPIIIVGSGRCGSTVFHRLLGAHPNLMWLSGFTELFPGRPALNRWAVTAAGNRGVRLALGAWIRPVETYTFWDRFASGFSEPCRDLVEGDATARVQRQLRSACAALLTRQRPRLLVKITGWPRIGFLKAVFPDAKFVHMVRDGRAVASSLLHINFWTGWRGPEGWRAGMLSPEDQATWERHDRSFVALAALEWRARDRAVRAARRALDPSTFHELRYEDFCAAPVESYRRFLDFAELPHSASFDRHVASAAVKSTSERWRDDLTQAQQGIVEEILQEDLRLYGYERAVVAPTAVIERDQVFAGSSAEEWPRTAF